MSESARDIIEPFLVQLLAQAGLEFFNRVVFELKWKPKNEESSSEDEKKPDKPTEADLALFMANVQSVTLPRSWLSKLFVEHRCVTLKCFHWQSKEEVTKKVRSTLEDKCLARLIWTNFEGSTDELLASTPEAVCLELVQALKPLFI